MLIRRRPQPRQRFSWRTLAFEVVVVVLGVTLALGANELRQRYLDAQKVREATAAIAAEMQQNCDRLTAAQDYHERVLAEIDSVRAADPSALEEFREMQRAVSSWQGYNPAFVTSAAYETAQATGALGLMPYERALGLGNYYTFLELYQATVRQAFGAVIEAGIPTIAQVEAAVQVTNEIQRELAPQSCRGAEQLGGDEPAESASDAPAAAS
jgi:hypothetical protein